MSAREHGDESVARAVPTEAAMAVNARVVDQWLREVAVPIAEATVADPSRSIPAEEVRVRIAAKRRARLIEERSVDI